MFQRSAAMTETFRIFRVDADEVRKIDHSINEPHSHDYEELIVGVAGQMEHFIDFRNEIYTAPFVSFVTKGKIHRVRPILKDGHCDMWVIRFKSEFIAETTFQLYANFHDNATLQSDPGRCFNRLNGLCEMIFGEMQARQPDLGVVRHLLSALFTMIESERRKQQPEAQTILRTQSITFKNFLRILEENFRRPEGVEFYAEKLFMSSRNLNLICQNILQQSVSEIIETRKLVEAKHLLSCTDKSVSEIGFELGYKEKAYFTNVFKKKSGQTPTEFREEMRKMVAS